MNRKSELICNICKLILKDPVSLPCSHAVCAEHFRDGTSKNGMIKCLICLIDFDVPTSGFEANLALTNLLNSESYLSAEEKSIKRELNYLIERLKYMHGIVKSKHQIMEVTSFDHFSEIRRQIDIRREELYAKIDNNKEEPKAEIDEIALQLIEQTREREEACKSKLDKTISGVVNTDLAKIAQYFAHEFRKPNLQFEEAKHLKDEYELIFVDFKAKVNEIASIGKEINSLMFKSVSGFRGETFGYLKSKELIACSSGYKIQIWNLDSNVCVATLQMHTANITCLENIDENRFASGSKDNTIRIWDAKDFVCIIAFITGTEINFLKSLNSNRLAGGSLRSIRIWKIESGECLQTLRYMLCMCGFVSLSNENCSYGNETIKMWDLEDNKVLGNCGCNYIKFQDLKKTLTWQPYHSSGVWCLILLRNGQLASGSRDKTIKIWNIESAECVQTLQGHSKLVMRLQQLESGELISCSSDTTIKIWNLTEGSCIRTLFGHTSSVRSIRLNNKNHTLVSCSEDGTIKTWDLKTCECVNTIVHQNRIRLEDLIVLI